MVILQTTFFKTSPEHVCTELTILDGITFQNIRLKVQEAKRSDTSLNEKTNTADSTFQKYLKNTKTVLN